MFERLKLDRDTVPTITVIVIAAVYAAAIPAVWFGTDRLYSIPFVLATVFPLVIYASHNPRLFFLVGMVFTAPLGLSINFRAHPHMGGAHAFSVNLMDFFVVPLVVFILRDIYRGQRTHIRLSTISAWWLGLTALGVYAMVVGPYREIAALEVFRMLKLWILFLVIVNECVREKQFRWVIAGLGANAVVNIVVAFLEFLIKGDLGLQPLGEASSDASFSANVGVYAQAGEVYRPSGLAGHANLLAAYMAMLLPIFIGQLYTRRRVLAKLLLAAISACGLIALFLTLSRSGWAAFAAAISLLMLATFMLPPLRGRYLALKATMISGGVAGLVIGAAPILRRLTESDPGALDFRWEWVGVAWNMVQDKPILGFGLNSFVYQLMDYAPYTIPKMYDLFGDLWPVVHNVYMIVWSEQGTVGLILFIGFLLNILWIAIKNIRYKGLSDTIYMLNLGAACGVVAIDIDGLSSFYIKVEAPAHTFWIVVGLIVAAHYWNLRNAPILARAADETQPANPPAGAAGNAEPAV